MSRPIPEKGASSKPTPPQNITPPPTNTLDRPDINAANLKGKNEIMQILKQGASRLGVTP